MSEGATPISSPPTTATGRFRSFAATTAANDAAISSVKLSGSSPMMGAASTPQSPAKSVLTAQTPTETAVGFVPDRSVMAGGASQAPALRPAPGGGRGGGRGNPSAPT